MLSIVLCPQKGTVNEIVVSSNEIASSMIDTFEKNGYKWVDYVDGKTEMAYTLERR